MRSVFPGYYRPTPDDLAARFAECVFAFDTNVLLNLYRFTPASRDDLLAVLRHDKIRGRVWLPHQVGLEYHNNRVEVIVSQREMYGKLKSAVDESLALFDQHKRSGNFHVTTLIEPVRAALDQVKAGLEKQKADHPDLLTADPILDALSDLFDGKVGPEYSAEEHKKKLTIAKARFENKHPPGYLDNAGRKKKEGDKKYGDVLLWLQLLDFAKAQDRPVVLVTDETGEDWWQKDDRRTLGPRPELVQEMHHEADRWFYMYSTGQFLLYSKEFLKLDVGRGAIEEARGIKDEDEERGRIEMSDVTEAGRVASGDGSSRSPLGRASLIAGFDPSSLIGVGGNLPAAFDSLSRTLNIHRLSPTVPDLSATLAPIFSYNRFLNEHTSGLSKVFQDIQERYAKLSDPVARLNEILRSTHALDSLVSGAKAVSGVESLKSVDRASATLRETVETGESLTGVLSVRESLEAAAPATGASDAAHGDEGHGKSGRRKQGGKPKE